MKLIVTIPQYRIGGVIHSSEALNPYLGNVKLIKRGKKKLGERKLIVGLRQIIIYLKFVKEIIIHDYDAILINASVSYYAIARDSIFIAISKIFRKNTVLFIHGYKIIKLNNRILFFVFSLSNHIFVLSNELKNVLISTGNNKSINITYNPVDISIIQAAFDEKPKNIINLLYLARVEREKGIFIALKTYKLIMREYPDMIFNIAGTGSAIVDAKQYVLDNDLKNVNFLGHIIGEEKIQLLQKSHIYILPTYHSEGLPVSMLEAMICGLAILTRPVGGITDFFENEKMGYISNSKNPNDFANGLQSSIENFDNISKYNKKFALNNFHPEIIAENFKKVIDNNNQ